MEKSGKMVNEILWQPCLSYRLLKNFLIFIILIVGSLLYLCGYMYEYAVNWFIKLFDVAMLKLIEWKIKAIKYKI